MDSIHPSLSRPSYLTGGCDIGTSGGVGSERGIWPGSPPSRISAAGMVTVVRGDKGAFGELTVSLKSVPWQKNVGGSNARAKQKKVRFKEKAA
jgi:hypothetical protein